MMSATKLRYCFIAFLALLPGMILSQELNCNVQISSQKIQCSNMQVFETMQREFYEFMNNTVWTNHIYSYA
ncbi:MAG TPA: DUF4835 family protein, partial [Bacteroidales bacterium]|nr:DUF4835 family protein [Bacteroidales bacterium]